MKRRFLALFLSGIMAFSLVACGSGPSGSGNSESGETVIKIPTYYTGENVGAIYFEPAVERFNEQNKGTYRVEIEEVVEDTYTEKISQLTQSGEIPVLISGVTTDWINTILIPNGYYYPMNDFLDAHPEIADLLIDASLEYSTLDNGDIVGVPGVAVTCMGTFYNTELYNPDVPISSMSMDEFIDSLGENTIAFQTVDNAWTAMLFLTALIANEEGGAELLQKYDGEKLYDFNQDCIIHAVEKLGQIWSTNAAANSVGAAYADAANAFMSSQAAVIPNGSWMNSEFSADGSDNWSGTFNGANVVADYYPGNVAISGSRGFGRWVMTNGGTEKEKECALAFLEFLYSQEELEKWALCEGWQFPNMKYSDDYLAALEKDALFRSQTELVTDDTVIVPSIASIMVDSVANDIFANDLVQFVNGAITAKEFCEDLTTKSAEAVED